MRTCEEIRKEVRDLSNIDLLDELQRPTGLWKEDIIRETLFRILNSPLIIYPTKEEEEEEGDDVK